MPPECPDIDVGKSHADVAAVIARVIESGRYLAHKRQRLAIQIHTGDMRVLRHHVVAPMQEEPAGCRAGVKGNRRAHIARLAAIRQMLRQAPSQRMTDQVDGRLHALVPAHGCLADSRGRRLRQHAHQRFDQAPPFCPGLAELGIGAYAKINVAEVGDPVAAPLIPGIFRTAKGQYRLQRAARRIQPDVGLILQALGATARLQRAALSRRRLHAQLLDKLLIQPDPAIGQAAAQGRRVRGGNIIAGALLALRHGKIAPVNGFGHVGMR
ncbi:hypothetical protein D3C81_1308640 [compost metagenome]